MRSLPVASRMCQCHECKEFFSTPANFDRHRKGAWDMRVCLRPEDVGLVKHPRGYWTRPADPNKRPFQPQQAV